MLLFAIDLIQFVDLHSQRDISIYNIYNNMTTEKISLGVCVSWVENSKDALKRINEQSN